MRNTDKPRLLIVDDEQHVCEAIRKVAERLGYSVRIAGTSREFFVTRQTFRPDIVMIDIVMPDVDGVEIIKQLAMDAASCRIIMMTGYTSGYLDRAIDLGRGLGLTSVTGLVKPLAASDLREALDRPAVAQPAPAVGSMAS